jgi:hypothetical protein
MPAALSHLSLADPWLVAAFSQTLRRRVAINCGFHRPEVTAAKKADLLTWAKYFLHEHFVKPPSEMHRWVAEEVGKIQNAECRMQNGDGENPNSAFCNLHSAFTSKLNLVGPRGSAKSTVVTLAHVLREAIEGRQPYIWIVCDTKRQAVMHLENIKHELLHNERLYEAYPQSAGQKGPMWQASAIVLPNGVKIEAIGSGQSVRGLRWRDADCVRRLAERRAYQLPQAARSHPRLVPRHGHESRQPRHPVHSSGHRATS